MAKSVVLGDPHGRDQWKLFVENNEYEHIYITGDYFDSFDLTINQQLESAQGLFAIAQQQPERIHLCLGNHDYHYLATGESYSGFQANHAHVIRDLLSKYINIFRIAYKHGPWVISHAGFTQTWLDNHKISTIEDVNKIKFNDKMFGFLHQQGTISDCYGNDIHQGPLWVRPSSLTKNISYSYPLQIIGHTQVEKKWKPLKGISGERIPFLTILTDAAQTRRRGVFEIPTDESTVLNPLYVTDQKLSSLQYFQATELIPYLKQQFSKENPAVIDFSGIKETPSWIIQCFEDTYSQIATKMNPYDLFLIGLPSPTTKEIWDAIWEKYQSLEEALSGIQTLNFCFVKFK